MILLDTDIMVDVLRGFPPAVAWPRSAGDMAIGLPGFVVLELIEGAATKREVNEIMKFVEPFPVYWPDAVDCERALHVFAQAHLSHRIDLVDVLNAETAIGLGVKLATHNRKHFQAIPQLETTQPYRKN